jgi:hypothetical protein
MRLRAERLLARAWERAHSKILPREGFLEDALAAALEHPAVWSQFISHFNWQNQLPQNMPAVRTQNAGAFGRTDIELSWASLDYPTLVLELKVIAPPTREQISRYLIRDDILIVGVGAWSNAAELREGLPNVQKKRLLDVVTWTQIRQLTWNEAPIELQQLHYLLDAMGVTMPRANEQQIRGLITSLPLWPMLDTWIPKGLSKVHRICTSVGMATTEPEHPGFENGWYAGRLDGQSAILSELVIWGGLILDDPSYPALSAGLPDLTLHLEINSENPLNQRLQDDADLTHAITSWIAAAPETEIRADHRAPEEWGILSVRMSSAVLLSAADQQQTFVHWLRDSARSMAEHGILGQIVTLAQSIAVQDSSTEE